MRTMPSMLNFGRQWRDCWQSCHFRIFHCRDCFFADTTQFQPPMVITQFQQFDGREGRLVDKTAELIQTNAITLRPNDPLISLSFALLSYEQLENIQYAYIIEGLDKDWTYQNEY